MLDIKLLVATHKPFKIPKGKFYLPIHVGRSVADAVSKDGVINSEDYDWLVKNTIGDNLGDNISAKNRFYCECSALYWAWKNYDEIGNPDYIGLMHYRRNFIFNDNYYVSKEKSKWQTALAYVVEPFIDDDYQEKIGLNDENILAACQNYDLVVSKDAALDLLNNRNLREDFANTIKGSKVKDFDLMVDIIQKDYPKYSDVLDANINGYKKSLYQMFIMKKELFFEYCEFLFGVLFKLEEQIDFEDYSINGKRTLGYLAENLLSIFVWKKETENLKILKLGVTQVEFPYEPDEIEKLYKAGCPSYLEYLFSKLKIWFSSGKDKENFKEKSKALRNRRAAYKYLKEVYHN